MLAQIAKYKTWFLCTFFFLLPWQTRWIFGQVFLSDADPYFPYFIINIPYIEPFATQFGILSLYATEALLIIGGVASLIIARPQIEKTYRLPVYLALGVFVMCALSLLSASVVARPLAATTLFHVTAAMGLFILMLDKQVAVRSLLAAFGAGLIIPTLLGLWQVVFDASPASTLFGLAERNAETLGDAVTVKDGVRELRAYGSFPHPNMFGGYLAVGVLALRGLLNGKGSERHRKVLLATMLLLATGLVFTWSRSALLGLFLGIGLAALVSYMKNTAKARIAVIPLAIVIIASALFGSMFAPGIAASLRGGGATETAAITERVEQYRDYPSVVADSWFTGSGVGTYVIDAFHSGMCTDWDCQPIHNVPLLIVAEIGLIGALVVFAWSSSIDRINFARFPNQDALVAFAMGNVVLVVLFFDHYIWSSWPGLALIAFVMAMTVRMGEKA